EFGAEVRVRALHPDDRERALDTYWTSIRDVRPYNIEYRFFDRRTGGYRWYLGRAEPLVDERGEVVRWFGTSTDIDDLKRNQIELERLSAIVQGSRDFVALFDDAGRAQFVNAAGLQLVGAGVFEELAARELPEFFVEQERDFVATRVLPAVLAEGRWSGELELGRATSLVSTPVAVDVFRIHGPETGRPFTFAAVARDIAERRRAESEREHLLASERRARLDAE